MCETLCIATREQGQREQRRYGAGQQIRASQPDAKSLTQIQGHERRETRTEQPGKICCQGRCRKPVLERRP